MCALVTKKCCVHVGQSDGNHRNLKGNYFNTGAVTLIQRLKLVQCYTIVSEVQQ